MRLLGLLKDMTRNKRNVVLDFTEQMKLHELYLRKQNPDLK